MPGHFYIEEKMDGERIQLHMDDYGKAFRFYSRKAKDYTYLYGNSLDSVRGGLTKNLKGTFHENVKSCILDGEMVAWDPYSQTVVPFGSVKTAAMNEVNSRNLIHPLFLVFDILYLNGQPLVDFKLSERRKALQTVVKEAKNYLKVLPYMDASTDLEIMDCLKKVIETASEGLVIKNPDSPYRVSERNLDWVKHKPDYLEEFGENLEVCIVGGYYGNGHRSKILASFLCALRVDKGGDDEPEFWSFCKVGGGLTAIDYKTIQHLTEGKWHNWSRTNPPVEFIKMAGKYNDREVPDKWIKPQDSIVIQIKGAQVITTQQFRTTKTIRFPRFVKIREDKDWKTCLSFTDFMKLEKEVEIKISTKTKLHNKRVNPSRIVKKRKIIQYSPGTFNGTVDSYIFDGYTFYILSDQEKPLIKRNRLEEMVLQNGGRVAQTWEKNTEKFYIIADKGKFQLLSIFFFSIIMNSFTNSSNSFGASVGSFQKRI